MARKTTSTKPQSSNLVLPPNHLDVLPNELLLYTLNLAAPRNQLNAFELQNELISQAAIYQRSRYLRPRSTEYAIGTKLQLKKLVKLLEDDLDRGKEAKTLVVDFSEDGNKGKETLLEQLLGLMPNLEEVELHKLKLGREIDFMPPGNLGEMIGRGVFSMLLGQKSMKCFTLTPDESHPHNTLLARDVARFFTAWPHLVRLQLPVIDRRRLGIRILADSDTAFQINPNFSHLSLAVNTYLLRDQAQRIIRAATTTLRHLELVAHPYMGDLAPIFTSPLVNLRHLTCISSLSYRNHTIPDYLTNALKLMVHLRSLEIGTNGYKDFAFIEQLPNLKALSITFPNCSLHPADSTLYAHFKSLAFDLESRLTQDRFDSITINADNWDRYPPPISDFPSLSATCTRLGIDYSYNVL